MSTRHVRTAAERSDAGVLDLEAARTEARTAVREVLVTQYGNEVPRLVLVDAVAGAGKTTLVVELVSRLVTDPSAPERVCVSANTDGQSFEIVARLLAAGCPTVLFAKAGKQLPSFDTAAAPLVVISSEAELVQLCPPHDVADGDVLASCGLDGPYFAVVANSAKWSFVNGLSDTNRPNCRPVAPLLVLDEAYQLTDWAAEQILTVGERYVAVGDPGQIDPPTTIELSEFAHRSDGPHRPFPLAQAERCADDGRGFVRLRLPYTRRCPADTTGFLQPFYEGPVASLVPDGLRKLRLGPASGPHEADALLDRLDAGVLGGAPGPAVLGATLPRRMQAGAGDGELARAIAAVITRALEREAVLELPEGSRPLETADMMVLATHHDQLSLLRQALAEMGLEGVRVGTADALQGLDAPLTFAWHPLSGAEAVDAFHCDSGRTCVMLSRHTVASVVFYREGTAELLDSGVPEGVIVPSRASADTREQAWRAQRELFSRLEAEDRVVALGAEPAMSRPLRPGRPRAGDGE